MSTTSPGTDVQTWYPGLPDAPPAQQIEHWTLVDLGQSLLDAMLDSVAVAGTLQPTEYSSRAETALREAGSRTHFSEAVTSLAETLMPGAPGSITAPTADRIAALTAGHRLADTAVWQQLAAVLTADAPYIAACTLAARRAARAARAPKTDGADR